MRIITGKYKGRHFDIPRSFKARPTTDFAKENIFNVLNGYIDFEGITALDLFAGTGSISLELLSRGCRQVVSVERDRDHAAFIRKCMDTLLTPHSTLHHPSPITHHPSPIPSHPSPLTSHPSPLTSEEKSSGSLLITGDVFRFLKSCKQQFDFIFADPPYALKELATLPDLILRSEPNLTSHSTLHTPRELLHENHSTLHTPRASSLLTPDGLFVLEHGKDHDFSHHPCFVEHRHYGSVNFSIFRP